MCGVIRTVKETDMITIMIMGIETVREMAIIMLMIRRNYNSTTLWAHLCKHVWGYIAFVKDYKHYHIIHVHMALPSGV